MGSPLPNHRGAASGAARVPRDLQCDLADRAARVHVTDRFSAETASTCRQRGIGFNSVSYQLRALHRPLTAGGEILIDYFSEPL